MLHAFRAVVRCRQSACGVAGRGPRSYANDAGSWRVSASLLGPRLDQRLAEGAGAFACVGCRNVCAGRSKNICAIAGLACGHVDDWLGNPWLCSCALRNVETATRSDFQIRSARPGIIANWRPAGWRFSSTFGRAARNWRSQEEQHDERPSRRRERHLSSLGPKAKCRRAPKLSAYPSRPELNCAQPVRRDCPAAVMGQKISCHTKRPDLTSQQRFARGPPPAAAGLKPAVGTLPRLKGRDYSGTALRSNLLAARLRAEVPISPPFLRGSRIRRRRFDPGADGLR